MAALVAKTTAPPRIALTKIEAAQSLGVSVDYFEAHVMGDLAVIREGRKVLVPMAELERVGLRASREDAVMSKKRRAGEITPNTCATGARRRYRPTLVDAKQPPSRGRSTMTRAPDPRRRTPPQRADEG